jgi:hypothetical protein
LGNSGDLDLSDVSAAKTGSIVNSCAPRSSIVDNKTIFVELFLNFIWISLEGALHLYEGFHETIWNMCFNCTRDCLESEKYAREPEKAIMLIPFS